MTIWGVSSILFDICAVFLIIEYILEYTHGYKDLYSIKSLSEV